jgi:hypothetical protein
MPGSARGQLALNHTAGSGRAGLLGPQDPRYLGLFGDGSEPSSALQSHLSGLWVPISGARA